MKQKDLEIKYELGDTTVDRCHCGRFYKNEEKFFSFYLIKDSCGAHKEDYKVFDQDGNYVCLKSEMLGEMEKSGKMEPGEAKSPLKEESSIKEKVMPEKKEESHQGFQKEKNMNQTQLLEKEKMLEGENITEKTKTDLIGQDPKGQEIIDVQKMPEIENGTEVILTESEKKSEAVEGEVIQPLDSNQLLTITKEESLLSVKQLNSLNECLIELAESTITRPVKDDDGEVIRRAQLNDKTVPLLQEIRGVLKLKVEFLKLQKDIAVEKAK